MPRGFLSQIHFSGDEINQGHVFEGYSVRALDYLMKPVAKDRLYHNLDKMIERRTELTYIYRKRDTILRIPYSSIITFTSRLHSVIIETRKEKYEQYISLAAVPSMLPGRFIRCHRTTIVNMDHVMKLDGALLTLSTGEILTVSKRYLEDVQDGLLKALE